MTVEVRDTGCGISDGDAERIFTSFLSTRKGAIGLGLSVCRSIVEMHLGSIEAERLPASGTCLRFRLPIHDPAQVPGL